MQAELEQYIIARCEGELEKNSNYMDMQAKMADAFCKNDIKLYSNLSMELQLLIEKTSYKAAAKDLISLAS